MKEELLNKLKQINPVDEDNIPKNQGNCQWCAIEGARVLLEDVEPTEIPSHQDDSGNDPIEERLHSKYGSNYVSSDDPEVFFEEIRKLNKGDLMLVSLENDDLDHAYIIYIDEEGDPYLIDPDRQLFVELDERENFYHSVKGWNNVETINYLNGDINSEFRDKIKVDICVLTKQAVESDPLPEFGSEPPRLQYM
ncbi:hypothetical protein [Legionella spiritensis]|uniref:Uncharacterized protein n=1 Tax=Legionella spiritensis TaxID=452 RepID=A0A0W0Z8D2_LEGSP|nr:hypothetical protein [Legionella spiritensis]KTD65351.1 hypothetical protein Lspi_0668 [Legionella spiritensis]SNV47349.1 Uncharacterised protein [Legionella spiritensis]